eukprot:TRINITY_DN10229_c0_g1_i6.p1 TRINITY_DN10229_c0_g1~~TRINITY_DN10229_c0_g1_i6.p1  ORF type:complete len:269 (-),score=50.11 TRINITY_DN10229_c0_g1_i6:132-938(-)
MWIRINLHRLARPLWKSMVKLQIPIHPTNISKEAVVSTQSTEMDSAAKTGESLLVQSTIHVSTNLLIYAQSLWFKYLEKEGVKFDMKIYLILMNHFNEYCKKTVEVGTRCESSRRNLISLNEEYTLETVEQGFLSLIAKCRMMAVEALFSTLSDEFNLIFGSTWTSGKREASTGVIHHTLMTEWKIVKAHLSTENQQLLAVDILKSFISQYIMAMFLRRQKFSFKMAQAMSLDISSFVELFIETFGSASSVVISEFEVLTQLNNLIRL